MKYQLSDNEIKFNNKKKKVGAHTDLKNKN